MDMVKAASLSSKVSSFLHLIPGTTTVRLDFPTVQILGELFAKQKGNLRGRRFGEQKSLEEEEISVDNDCCGGRVGCLFRCPCSGNSSVLK